MKFFSRLLLGLLLLAPSVAEAQKKDPGRLITTTPLPQVPELPDAFPQVLGTQVIGPAYKFTKEDPIVEGAMVVQNLGSRILKVQVPPGPQFNQLIAMPFTHYLVWFRSNGDWSKGFTPEMRRREYNATYAFTKDLLTRRETTGKTFFIGHWEGDWYLLPDRNTQADVNPAAAAAMVEWLNVRQEAVDDARAEVPYTRCRVYTYAEVNRVRDAMVGGKKRMANLVVPKLNVDFLSYAAYDCQLLPAAEVTKTLDWLNGQLPPKANLPAKRVFIGECGLSWTACGSDGKIHEQKNREIFTKFLSWRPPLVLYWQVYNNEVVDGQQVGFWLVDNKNKKTPLYETMKELFVQQEEAAKEMRRRSNRLPAFEQIAEFSENWLAQKGK
ncbi:hypothetical protein EMGBS8_13950 [Verrucomicrobiota bacterium]|jgi:hypothetical protein|nr:hypothetical protein EMGBS8_13950 [Verrucomicrobiota bacterium]